MLAINGGNSIRNTEKNPWPGWPVWGEEEKRGLIEVLESGIWSYNGPRERAFINAWNQVIGSKYSLLTSNGTVSLQLALEALNIGVGDEVIVPGITWQATAAAVVDVNAVPILTDVEDDTWCVDPRAVEANLTERTRAIIPVHLYGSIADMDAIGSIAKKHGLHVIEDAAHQHGAEWRNRSVGSLGDIGSFSLQLSKVLTAGEGGILTTADQDLWFKLDALRNCGRRPTNMAVDKSSGDYGLEGDFIQSGNYRITEFQASILLAQLGRLGEQNKTREKNAHLLDSMLKELPGIHIMREDSRETKKAYFNYAFRISPEETGLPAAQFRSALSAELGIGAVPCYQPLNDCTLYRPLTKKRHHLNKAHMDALNPGRFKLPVAEDSYRNRSVTLPHRVLLGTSGDIEQIYEAVKKVMANKNSLGKD